ncbi:MAG TPA: choice-of-anchor Q domain-containing protein, partial [Xanthomonadaceae bacterium]|nr:choice-of-anchor Q domain-containing protein [Xanthomonadaceae bacterium]
TADFVVSGDPSDSHDANPGNGVCADSQGRCSLRAAVQEANALGGPRRIALSPRTYRLDQGEIEITGDIEIIGVGVGLSEIVSDGAFRIFDVAPGSSLTLRDLSLSGTERVPDGGGLVYNQSTLIVEDAMLQNGHASSGGALFNAAGATLELRRVALVGNRASGAGFGGAITNQGSAALENVLLTDNRANAGGAVYTAPLGATVSLTLDHCTVVGNRTSSVGPGLFNSAFTSAPIATLRNTILADNLATQEPTECWSQLLSAGGNIVNDDLDLCGFAVQPGDQLGVAPGLEAYLSTGDRMPTVLPTPSSAAIGAAIGDCPDTDLRGLVRDPASCDVGAYRAALGTTIFLDGFE